MIPPPHANGGVHLFPEYHSRKTGANQVVECRPQVPFVCRAFTLSRATERLTRTGAGPDSGNAFKSGPPQGECPSADAGEEVALVESGKVIRFDFKDAPFVNVPRRNLARRDQLAEPRARLRVVVVVVVHGESEGRTKPRTVPEPAAGSVR